MASGFGNLLDPHRHDARARRPRPRAAASRPAPHGELRRHDLGLVLMTTGAVADGAILGTYVAACDLAGPLLQILKGGNSTTPVSCPGPSPKVWAAVAGLAGVSLLGYTLL